MIEMVFVVCNLVAAAAAVPIHVLYPNSYAMMGMVLVSLADSRTMRNQSHVTVCMDLSNHWMMMVVVEEVDVVVSDNHCLVNSLALENVAVDHYKWRFQNKSDDQLVSHYRIDPNHSWAVDNPMTRNDFVNRNGCIRTHQAADVAHNNRTVVDGIYPVKMRNKKRR